MKNLHSLLLTIVVATLGLHCSSSNPALSSLQGTAWVQRAAEYEMLAIQAYQMAEKRLPSLLADSLLTAELTQSGDRIRSLPPAVILDIDETVLDNSPYQARLIRQAAVYSDESWNSWVNEAQAEAVPGALSFTQRAHNMGITVFYLSNRDASTEQATRSNLLSLGFPVKEGVDVILLKGEYPGWTSAKTARRDHLAQNYRILMLFGDDMNDFLPAKNRSNTERAELVQIYRRYIGSRWFVLPNPVYGSWSRTLESDDLMDALITAQE